MTYPICKIKNISGEIKSLHEKEFQIDEIFMIEDSKRQGWANNDDVITAIVNNDFEIHDATEAIIGINNQIDYLKTNIPKTVEITNEPKIEYTSKYFMKAVAVRKDCPKGTTTNIDLKIEKITEDLGVEELEKETNCIYKYLKGGVVFAEGSGAMRGDSTRFSIIDKDAVLVTLGVLTQQEWDYIKGENDCVIVKTYIPLRYININNDLCNMLITESPGKIPVGLYLRCKYTAIDDGNTRDIIVNYDLQNKD